jgi:hypothetical protein
MNIRLPPDRTEDEVVDFVLMRSQSGTVGQPLLTELQAEFLITSDDAELAVDRIYGGVLRAGTRNSANRPERIQDPLAWISYGRAVDDPSIISKLFPG